MKTRVQIAGEGFFLLRERDIQKEFHLSADDMHFLTQQHSELTAACRFFEACKLFVEQGDPCSEYTQSSVIYGNFREKINGETFDRRRERAQKVFLNKVSDYFIDAYGLPLRNREMIGPYDTIQKACSLVRIDEALDMLSRRCSGAKNFEAFALARHLADFRMHFDRRSSYLPPVEPTLSNGRVLILRNMGSPANMAHILSIFERGTPAISAEIQAGSLPFDRYTTKGEPGVWQALPFLKVTAYRYFKNGRADLRFMDNAQRQRFCRSFCGGA